MTKKKLLIILCIISLYACDNQSPKVDRITNVKYDLVTDSIYTRMPGSLLYSSPYLMWMDPFETKGFVHVLDANSGQELNTFGNVGDGPREFSIASGSVTYDSNLLLYDQNKNQFGLVNAKKISHSDVTFEVWGNEELRDVTRFLQIDEQYWLLFQPGGNRPFILKSNVKTDSVGQYPFPEKIKNGFDIYQGAVYYNPIRKTVIYSTYHFFYVAMYSFENGNLTLKWEISEPTHYQIVDGKMKIDKEVVKGFSELAISKDYIIGSRRDIEFEGSPNKNAKGLDLSQSPRSLFVYDYNGKLKKILNMDFPILRLTADINTNTVYAVVVNPEFSIIKFVID